MPSFYYRDKLSYMFSRMAAQPRIYGFVYAREALEEHRCKDGFWKGRFIRTRRGWAEAHPVEGSNLYACFLREDISHGKWVSPWRIRTVAQVSHNGKSAFTKEEAQALICAHEQVLAGQGYNISTAQPFRVLLRKEPALLTHESPRLA